MQTCLSTRQLIIVVNSKLIYASKKSVSQNLGDGVWDSLYLSVYKTPHVLNYFPKPVTRVRS